MTTRFLLQVLTLVLLGAMGSQEARAEALPPLKAEPSWLITQESGGVAYFVQTTPARIRRYDVAAAAWLSDIALSETPTAFTVDAQHLYVSFGRRTSRFALDGSGEAHVRNTTDDVRTLFVVGDFLYLGSYNRYWSVEKATGDQIDYEEYFYSLGRQVSVAPTRGKVFGRSSGVSPSDIFSVTLNPDGTFGEMGESPYHGDYPSASRTYVFPGEARVADDAGIVYNTRDLTYSHSLGGSFQDLAFYGDLPIVARNGEVIAYSNAFLETGRYKPANPPLDILVHGREVVSFYESPAGIGVERFSLDLLQPAEPGEPVDPAGLPYEPDQVVVGKDQVVYLLSRAHLSIFRWSIPLQRYLETIPLLDAPSYMAYSEETHRLYLSYSTGTIYQIRLAESIREVPFANSPAPPCGLATAGEYVFTCDQSGAWVSHFVYHPDGRLISQKDWNYWSLEYVWNEVNRRMYFFRDDTSPNDVHWEEVLSDGSLGEAGESPYHGDIQTLHPIRIFPDGKGVLLGSGEILDATTLELEDSLSNPIDDAAWVQGTLFTLRTLEGGGGVELQKWGHNYGFVARRQFPGEALRLFGRRNHLLVISQVGGVPQFSFWDSNLSPLLSAEPLSLGDGRFSVSAVWQIPNGSAGEGHPVQLTRDTGYFWFFNQSNVEIVVKVLDACSFSDRFWVFAGGLTNVDVELTVVDNLTGQVRTYHNPQGRSFQPLQDTAAFDTCHASQAAGPAGAPDLWTPAAAPILLNSARFDVEISWTTPQGQRGTGQAVALTADTGYFWFFDPANVEVVVKVLDGCAINGQYWVFASGLTNVATEMRVTDTQTGQSRIYRNPQNQAFLPVQDTGAFDGCP
jgi:hypothetical protein